MFKRIYIVVGLVILLIQAAPVAAQGPIEPKHTDPGWQAWYWNNPTLSGQPILQRFETHLDHDWRSGSPAPSINADRFSAHWTRYIDVAPGNYRFTATADDGIRLWVDNELIINQWQDQAPTTYSAETYLGPGHHLLKVEYYENVGEAVAKVSWTPVGPATGGWRAEYYNNTSLSGYPALVREDAAIDFHWGNNSPAPGRVNPDGFSVRWSRSLNLSSDNYRFTLTVDDGARLYVNGHLLIDAWRDQGPTTYHGEIFLPDGLVTIQMEYYEHHGGALAQLSWDSSGEPPPPPPADPMGYVRAHRLNVRSGPGFNYSIKGWLHRGQPVLLLGRNSKATWLKMETRSGFEGWVSARHIRSNVPIRDLPVLHGPPSVNPMGYVRVHKLNVRSGPGLHYGIKGWFYKGRPVLLLGRNSRATWLKVGTKSGFEGWVSDNYIRSNVPTTSLPVVQ